MKNIFGLITLFALGCNYPELKPGQNDLIACAAMAQAALKVYVQDQAGNGINNATVVALETQSNVTEGLLQGFLPDSIYYGAYERTGMYEVNISAPGFQNQTITNIHVVRVGCSLVGGEFSVTLQH